MYIMTPERIEVLRILGINGATRTQEISELRGENGHGIASRILTCLVSMGYAKNTKWGVYNITKRGEAFIAREDALDKMNNR